MKTNAIVKGPIAGLVVGSLLTATLSGCGATAGIGRPAAPLSTKREDPGVVLCLSERDGAGIRIIGQMEPGIHPVTRVTFQYKLAGPSDRVPATTESEVLELTGARAENVNYRKGAEQVVYTIDGSAAQALRGKVLWYRWIVEYDRGGRAVTDRTDIHRTSLAEAGHPRSAASPGPDSSVVAPTTRRR